MTMFQKLSTDLGYFKNMGLDDLFKNYVLVTCSFVFYLIYSVLCVLTEILIRHS